MWTSVILFNSLEQNQRLNGNLTVIHQQSNSAASTSKVMQFSVKPIAVADSAAIARLVDRVIDARRQRGSFFPASLFADPAWDILLVLTLAEARYHRMTVSNVCDSVDTPATTALRWINTLTRAGLLVRREDMTDKRRKYLELSASAYAQMVEYCSSLNGPIQLAAE